MKSRDFSKAFLPIMAGMLFVFVCQSVANDGSGPEPAPWWQRVEETQSLALKWLAALTVIGAALASFIAFVVGKVNELKATIERQGARVDGQQAQIHNIALAAGTVLPTPGSGETVVTSTTNLPTSAVALLAFCALSLAACDTIYYPNGQVAGRFGSDRLNETMSGAGMYYHVDGASHSAVAKAHWHGVIGLGGEALGAYTAGIGAPMVGAAVTGTSAIVNRPTTRATPAPAARGARGSVGEPGEIMRPALIFRNNPNRVTLREDAQ